MPASLEGQLVVAISSRALFDFEEENQLFEAGDDQAWTMLARSYAVLQRFPEASKAFARARELAPENPQLMADHADVLAMLQGQRVAGEPAQLAQRALTIDPDNLKAMALAGSAAFEDRLGLGLNVELTYERFIPLELEARGTSLGAFDPSGPGLLLGLVANF